MRFEDRVLFVTGGASGIGRATAERVVSEGGRAAIVDLDLVRAEEAAAALPGCIGLAANVADEAQVAAGSCRSRRCPRCGSTASRRDAPSPA